MKRLILSFSLGCALLVLIGAAASNTPVRPVTPVLSMATGSTTEPLVAAAEIAAAAPARAPAHSAPAAAVPAGPARSVQAPAAAAPAASRTGYLNAMYIAVVPAAERAKLAGRYTIGYDLAGLSCGTGCTGMSGGQVRSSFNDAFFSSTPAYQRNILAHEAAHAYGFLYITDYTTPSWAGAGGWQAEFHALDRSFAATYDAEAWAACIAWDQSGFNNRVNQISHVCTAPAAALAVQSIQ